MTSDGTPDDARRELARLAEGTPRDLRGLQVRVSPAGPHAKQVPSLAFTTYLAVLDPSLFVTRPGLDPRLLWCVTVRPEEMLRLVTALLPVDAAGPPLLLASLVLRDSRLGDADLDLPVGAGSARGFLDRIGEALAPDAGLGRELVDLFRAGVLPRDS